MAPNTGFSVLTDFIGLLALLNPLGVIPIFISLTQGMGLRERNAVAKSASTAAAVIMLVTAFVGKYILLFFGISIPDFRIAGGILILLIGLSMLHGQLGDTRHTPEEIQAGQRSENFSVVPLAMPLLAGPGVISSVIVDENAATGWVDSLGLVLVILLAAAAVYVALRAALPLSGRLGVSGIKIATRISGLILASIAVNFITSGLGQIFPVLR